LKEAFDFSGSDALDESKYPVEVPGFKDAVDEFRKPLINLGKKVLRAFSDYLGIDKDLLIKKHQNLENPRVRSQTVIRTNYYFEMDSTASGISEERESMRLGEHCDWGTFTFLIQDSVGGLEAKLPSGEWIPVPPVKDSIILNAGLMMEIWSGGKLLATPHRVRALKNSSGSLRQSLGFFLQPDGHCHCEPLVQKSPGWNPVYPLFEQNQTHYEYFQNRVANSRAY